MNKRNVLIIGAIAAVFATSAAFAQSSRDADADSGDPNAERSVESDAKRKAERRARNEAAAAARDKAGEQKRPVAEEEEERRKKP